MDALIIPLVAIICAVGLPTILAILASYMTIKSRHAERMAMIERGMTLEEIPKPERRPNRYSALRNGIFMIGLALGILVGLYIQPHIPPLNDWVDLTIPTFAILFGGLAFIVYFFLSRYLMAQEEKEDANRKPLI